MLLPTWVPAHSHFKAATVPVQSIPRGRPIAAHCRALPERITACCRHPSDVRRHL
jgi:hypothetical protein